MMKCTLCDKIRDVKLYRYYVDMALDIQKQVGDGVPLCSGCRVRSRLALMDALRFFSEKLGLPVND